LLHQNKNARPAAIFFFLATNGSKLAANFNIKFPYANPSTLKREAKTTSTNNNAFVIGSNIVSSYQQPIIF
jgi:hypothetical protein